MPDINQNLFDALCASQSALRTAWHATKSDEEKQRLANQFEANKMVLVDAIAQTTITGAAS